MRDFRFYVNCGKVWQKHRLDIHKLPVSVKMLVCDPELWDPNLDKKRWALFVGSNMVYVVKVCGCLGQFVGPKHWPLIFTNFSRTIITCHKSSTVKSQWFLWQWGDLLTYHLVMTNSLPWKIPTIDGGFDRWEENHLFLWAMASMAMLNNQRV